MALPHWKLYNVFLPIGKSARYGLRRASAASEGNGWEVTTFPCGTKKIAASKGNNQSMRDCHIIVDAFYRT